jgi:uncharacterized membrane protein YsdA (DUF1294 family)
MRSTLSLACSLLLASSRALAQDAPAAPPAEAPAVEAPPVHPGLSDPNARRRKVLFDLAFTALVSGNLPLAESAFAEAQVLPGDPAQSAVAASFVERVQHLRARKRTEGELESRVPAPTGPERGHTERLALLGATTALGLGLYGWALPYSLGLSPSGSTKGFAGVYMVTAAASFIAPYLLLGDRPVSAGQANLAFYGGTRGIWAGVLVTSLIAGEASFDRRSQAWSAGMLTGSLVGLMGGYQLARFTDMTAGDARTVAAMGDFGLAFGFGAGFLLRLDAGPASPQSCQVAQGEFRCMIAADTGADKHARQMAAAGLVGLSLGLGGGYVLAHHRDNTWGDGEVLRGATALGVYAGLGLGAAAKMDINLSNRALTATMMFGGTMGVLLGDRLVRHTDFTPGQSMLLDLSMVSGGLLGAGLAELGTKSSSGARPYLAASAGGALLGFGLGYWKLHDAPEGRLGRQLSGLPRAGLALAPLAGTQGERGLALAGRF